ncbi:unnamed protein product [Oikopleura dioica]|uniref:Uncharacterized protein n=1 Tax=Oikopleura dioica TaxID=34765 RepID=E4YB19_OIKDI|nr:unnamed protein product [Oikopleura dioica]
MSRFNVSFSERLFLIIVQCYILLIFSCFLFEYFKTEQILSGQANFLKSTAFNVSLLAFLIGSYVHLGKALSIFRSLFADYEEALTNLKRIFARRCLILASFCQIVVIFLLVAGLAITQKESQITVDSEILSEDTEILEDHLLIEHKATRSIPEIFAGIF